jgi:hypothetical protein
MANVSLVCHPLTPMPAVRAIKVTVERRAHRLLLAYAIDAAPRELRLPPPGPPERASDLWRTTCCEAFLHAPVGEPYLEFNFSPSSKWAAYRFHAERVGQTDLGIPPPAITFEQGADRIALTAEVALPDAWRGTVDVAPTVVIETRDRMLSYWALSHPQGEPNFHGRDPRAVRLDPKEAA